MRCYCFGFKGRKVYQHLFGRCWLRYAPNGLWMLCKEEANNENANRESHSGQGMGLEGSKVEWESLTLGHLQPKG